MKRIEFIKEPYQTKVSVLPGSVTCVEALNYDPGYVRIHVSATSFIVAGSYDDVLKALDENTFVATD